MKKIIILICSIASFQVLAQDCNGIISHGMRNIAITKSEAAAQATKYYRNCGKNYKDLAESQLVEAEVEVFGSGKGGGSYSREHRESELNQWCTTNKESAQNHQNLYTESQTIYSKAVEAWASCNALLADKVHIDPQVSTDNRTVLMSIRYTGTGAKGPEFYGIEPREGFDCNVKAPSKINSELMNSSTETSSIKYLTNSDILKAGSIFIGPQSISVSCITNTRNEKVGSDIYKLLERGTIGVRSADHPFMLYFPEERDPPFSIKEAEKIQAEISKIQSKIDNNRVELTESINKLTNQLIEQNGKINGISGNVVSAQNSINTLLNMPKVSWIGGNNGTATCYDFCAGKNLGCVSGFNHGENTFKGCGYDHAKTTGQLGNFSCLCVTRP